MRNKNLLFIRAVGFNTPPLCGVTEGIKPEVQLSVRTKISSARTLFRVRCFAAGVFIILFILLSGCYKKDKDIVSAQGQEQFLALSGLESKSKVSEKQNRQKIENTLLAAKIPDDIGGKILAADQNDFLKQLQDATSGDPFLYVLVDKQHKLPDAYTPNDLVKLNGENKSYTISRTDLSLRVAAEESFEAMAKDARAQGVNLMASSTYRSYEYQVEVYNRNAAQNGKELADRESARPGHSQHQLGLVIDFGSITDDYAYTKAGRWITENAWKYGWSISFPDGYEDITGYRWECWHYRFVGKPLALFIKEWFAGVQQYALQFIYVWENGSL
ncbi:MAG: hypothetical protein Ta2B_04200 [Termitinemataceae bacterium]|nr:MAG: hypothetical protein Ta2B_04200 [Termitinemataceae bacterium]